jgi:hypothetical protein
VNKVPIGTSIPVRLLLLISVFALLGPSGCTKLPTAQVKASSETVQFVRTSILEKGYRLLVHTPFRPGKLEDLEDAKLIFFDKGNENPTLDVVLLGGLTRKSKQSVFSSSTYFRTAENLLSGSMKSTGTVTQQNSSFSLPREGVLLAKKEFSDEQVVSKCLDELKATPKSVSLTNSGPEVSQRKELVELVFAQE